MAGVTRLARRGALIVSLLVAWEIAARAQLVSAFLLPSPVSVLHRLYADAISGQLPIGLGLSIYRSLAGFAIAGALGVAIGILVARVRIARWFFDPLVSVGLPVPKIAFLPIFILWFGVFDESKILMVAFSSVFPVIVAAAAGTENVERVLLWSARSLGATDRGLLWEVALPAAFPQIMTGLQVALPIAMVTDIVVEMQMGGEGLGGDMIQTMRFADSPGVFSGIIAIAIAGYALVKAMEVIRRHLLVWHAEAEQA